jgi:hypothetical protein
MIVMLFQGGKNIDYGGAKEEVRTILVVLSRVQRRKRFMAGLLHVDDSAGDGRR